MGVRSHALGEQSFPPALADDPVRCAGGGHHDDHSDEAAGEGDYLQNNRLSQWSHPDRRHSINLEQFPRSVSRGSVLRITRYSGMTSPDFNLLNLSRTGVFECRHYSLHHLSPSHYEVMGGPVKYFYNYRQEFSFSEIIPVRKDKQVCPISSQSQRTFFNWCP